MRFDVPSASGMILGLCLSRLRAVRFAFAFVSVITLRPLSASESPRTTGSPFLHAWRSEDYGASPVNWRIEQHPTTGYIYATNNLGVLEFDGAAWRLIPLPHGGAARALAIDPAGTIWVGGVGELAMLVPSASGDLRAVDQTARVLAALGNRGRAAASVADAGDDDTGDGASAASRLGSLNRAVATPEGVVFRVADGLAQFSTAGVLRIVPAKLCAGQLWWMDSALHVEELTRGARRVDEGRLLPVVGDARINAFAAQPDPHGGWRLLSTHGPIRWAGPGHAPLALEEDAESMFRDEQPTCAVFLADGRSVYGTTRSGLIVFDRDGRFDRRVDRRQGLPGNRVNGICVDREGGVWLATPTGIVRVQLDSPFAAHGEAQGLTGGPRELMRVGDRLYLTHGEGFAWRADADGQFFAVNGFRTGSHHVIPHAGGVLVSGQGLHEVMNTGEDRALAGPYLYGLAELRRAPGHVLASSALALRFFSRDSAGRWQQAGQLATLPSGVDDILERDDGFVWVTTRTGEIWRIDFSHGIDDNAPARRYGPEHGVPTALRRDNLRVFTLGPDLLAASAHWLLRYDAAADRFVPETRFPALGFAGDRGPEITAPAADGGAWFYGRNPSPQFSRLRPDGEGGWRVERLAAAPLRGLAINSLFHDAAQDTLWVAGQGALVSLDLTWHPAGAVPPLRAVVRRVKTPDGRILAAPDARPAALALAAENNSLRFEFAAPTFECEYRGATSLSYRTRLAGLDRDWSAWSDEARRDVSNLPPGAFTFLVEVRDLNGRAGAATPFAFTVAAPWWRTPWAFAGAALLLALVVTGIVKLRTRTLSSRNAHLEEIVAARTAELERLRRLELDEKIAAQIAEEKAQLEMLRYQLNPHFLFNALNSIYGLVYPHSKPAGELVRRLAEFCRGTLTRTDDQWHSLAEECAMLRTYLDIEQARWRERLVIEFALDPAAANLRLPAFLLLPVVDNAIKHGSATSPDVLSFHLTTRATADGTVTIEVANTGTWLAPSDPRATASTGVGLENLRTRLHRAFADTHALNVTTADGWVVVRLQLGLTKT